VPDPHPSSPSTDSRPLGGPHPGAPAGSFPPKLLAGNIAA
jgi:hypothetical protein